MSLAEARDTQRMTAKSVMRIDEGLLRASLRSTAN